MAYKSLEQTIRSQWQRPVMEQAPVYQDGQLFESTDTDLARMQRIAHDAAKHNKRVQWQLRIIDEEKTNV